MKKTNNFRKFIVFSLFANDNEVCIPEQSFVQSNEQTSRENLLANCYLYFPWYA